MVFDGKPTNLITSDEIEQLVRERIQEDSFLDYKARSHRLGENGVHELLKDVCAFANAQGGYLLIGVGPSSQDPRRPEGFVSIEDPERERRWMIDHCIEKIEPRLPDLDIRAFSVGDKNVIVCHVPESGQKPHCARPDRERHFFWRRYEDGNRLMSVPEIRDCLAGDHTLRLLTRLQREIAAFRRDQFALGENERPVHQNNVLQLRTPEAFHRFVDARFEEETQPKPYFRLTATLLPVNRHDLRAHREALRDLLGKPPGVRSDGFGITPLFADDLRHDAIGLLNTDKDHCHLRLLWNGHLEFWRSIDRGLFSWDQQGTAEGAPRFLFPLAFIEPAVNFVLIAAEVCRLAGHTDDLEFKLAFHHIRGRYLAPHAPDTWGYSLATQHSAQSDVPDPFKAHRYNDEHLKVQGITVAARDLPGAVAWRLISEVYYRFAYNDEQIPFFDLQRRFTIGT